MADTGQAEKTTFTREATGLVREIGAWPSFFATWFLVTGGVPIFILTYFSSYPGANFPLIFILALFPTLALAVLYTIFSISMPRSGGDYVYVSRGLHPFLGFVNSFSSLKPGQELEAMVKNIKDVGYYPFLCDRKEVEELNARPELVTQTFNRLMVEDVRRWVSLTEERLKGTGIRCYISPGNDDILEVDKELSSSTIVENPEEKVVSIDGTHEMITLGTTNRTPWHSPREVDEDVLEGKIDALAAQVKEMSKAIFNVHVPPKDTAIDQAPKLDENLAPVTSGGQIVMAPAGSTASRNSILKHQPLMGLHGHIHESRGLVKLGRTLCFNPGSEYGEGILRGLLCDIEGVEVKSYLLTSG